MHRPCMESGKDPSQRWSDVPASSSPQTLLSPITANHPARTGHHHQILLNVIAHPLTGRDSSHVCKGRLDLLLGTEEKRPLKPTSASETTITAPASKLWMRLARNISGKKQEEFLTLTRLTSVPPRETKLSSR